MESKHSLQYCILMEPSNKLTPDLNKVLNWCLVSCCLVVQQIKMLIKPLCYVGPEFLRMCTFSRVLHL